MENVALVTLLLLIQYFAFMMAAGMARGKGNVKAPAITGDENFERKLRIQMNTLEGLIIVIPSLWVCTHFFSANVAVILGLVFCVGRVLYSISYTKAPEKRGPGMMIGMIAMVGLIGCSAYGILI